MSGVSRRGFIAGTGAALAVTAFDPTGRLFITEAHASSCTGAISIPRLDGTLSVDPADLAAAGQDYGGIVSTTPRAVLQPGSVRDIRRVIRYARRHHIKVAMRGISHSVFGQAQVDCGIVIDSSSLDAIHSIDSSGAWVDAGVKWSTLILAALDQGLAPKVLTDYIELTVGGVLSVGGIGGVTNRHGFVSDNVSELEVIDGRGRRRTCSRTHRRDLFDAVRGGLGQFAIITKAKIDLEAAPALARVYDLVYTSLPAYLADQRKIAADDRFNFIEGQIISDGAGGWNYQIQAAQWYTPPTAPDDATLTGDLNFVSSTITDFPYFVWLNRVAFAEQALRDAGLWDLPKPWSDIFVPDRNVESYISNFVSTLGPDDLGAGLILLYPFRRHSLGSPFVATPHDSVVWAFDILRIPFTPDPVVINDLVSRNRTLYDNARALGGKRYPIGAVEFSQRDWVRNYGYKWFPFLFAKARFDPFNVLTPGQGIFRR